LVLQEVDIILIKSLSSSESFLLIFLKFCGSSDGIQMSNIFIQARHGLDVIIINDIGSSVDRTNIETQIDT